ncbi:MAG: OmpA family protein [Polyangiaceae bacterium]|jgi:OmpA-OmpF porin, OOP family
MNAKWLLLLPAATVSTVLFEGRALAQASGFALDRFDPAPAGSEWFALDSLDLRGNLRPAAGVIADYAHKPLVIYNPDGSERSAVVKDQLFLHVAASVVFADRLRLALNLPVAAFQDGDGGAINGVTIQAPTKPALGDLRLDADVRLFGSKGDTITLAMGAQVFLPTGDRALFAGDGGVRVAPHLVVAGEVGAFAYAASAGFMVHTQQQAFVGNAIGDELILQGAIGVKLADGHVLVGPEVFGRTDLTDPGVIFARDQSPLEALFGAHVTAGDWRFGAGAGHGFTEGFGSPEVRVVGSIEFAPAMPVAAPEEPPPDRDGDGVPDAVDACPDEPGERTEDPKTNGCPAAAPVADKDKDGVPDDSDACPDVPGVKTDDPKTNGCPPDRDHDGVADADDACPDVAGVKTDDPKTNGCPPDPDRDKDGIPNDKDACPDTPGSPNPDPSKNGCPRAVVQQGQIKILDQVKFRTGSAVILPESDGILGAVLKILTDHPEIKQVSVEGHTDNRGGAQFNQTLSRKRAASVVKWLVSHGVDASRLSSMGYGQDRPIDSNATDEGRQNNRRVEFHISGGQ